MPSPAARGCSVVILNYRGCEDTLACLAALRRLTLPPRSVIVVDNASGGGETRRLLEGWRSLSAGGPGPQLIEHREGMAAPSGDTVLQMPENLGFAGGNNAALRLLQMDPACNYAWLLNNDTLPGPEALEKLLERFDESPGLGMAGSTLTYLSAPDTVQCASGASLSPWTGATRMILGHESVERALRTPRERVEEQLAYVVGASVLLRMSALGQTGLMPEEYFLYYEDAAWGHLFTRAGFGLGWARESIVVHKEGGSTGAHTSATATRAPSRSRFIDYLSLRNRAYLIRTRFPLGVPSLVLSFAGVILNRICRGEADRAPLALKALADGLLGRMGRPEAEP